MSTTKKPRGRRSQPDEAADELALFAIEEEFIAEYRAGRQPRLTLYLQRYPTHATALTDFAATFLSAPDDALSAADADTPQSLHTALSPGTRRALDRIFSSGEQRQPPLRKVAESPAPYNAKAPIIPHRKPKQPRRDVPPSPADS